MNKFFASQMKKLLIILGPTATGKTDLALNLAKKYNGELVSCDSRQVYKGLDIGTGKEPGIKNEELRIKKKKGWWEIDGVKVWMLDVVKPETQYTVADYVKDAWKVIEDIEKRGKLPIIVGGTGLYLKALLEGLSNLSIPVDEKLRGELSKLTLGQLQNKLLELSPAKFESLNNSEKNNPRRLLRSIELILMYGHKHKYNKLQVTSNKFKILKVGLTASREVLNKRIDFRLLARLDQGLIKEAEKLHKEGLSFKRMKELGLEYGCLAELLEGKLNIGEFIEKLKNKIHQYAKRQMTWFNREKNIKWFDISGDNWSGEVEKLVDSWYHQEDD